MSFCSSWGDDIFWKKRQKWPKITEVRVAMTFSLFANFEKKNTNKLSSEIEENFTSFFLCSCCAFENKKWQFLKMQQFKR